MRYSILSTFLLGTLTAQTTDYFPLHAGNEWIYRERGRLGGGTIVVDIPRMESFQGREYAVVRGLAPTTTYLRLDERGVLYRYNPETRTEQVWAEFATPTGGSYETAADPCNKTARVERRDAQLKTPAAEFFNGFRAVYTPTCADAGLTHEVYVPYIGLVQRESTTIAGPRTMELIYARVGGVTVLSEPELTTSLSLDRAVYDSGSTLSARLTLRSTHAEPIELRFRSSQRYDLTVRNDKGESVYLWSASVVFLAVLGTERIGPGQRTWVIDAPLNLPAGNYTAEGWITAEDGKRFAASAGFRITQ
jgi:hypothetical protein